MLLIFHIYANFVTCYIFLNIAKSRNDIFLDETFRTGSFLWCLVYQLIIYIYELLNFDIIFFIFIFKHGILLMRLLFYFLDLFFGLFQAYPLGRALHVSDFLFFISSMTNVNI